MKSRFTILAAIAFCMAILGAPAFATGKHDPKPPTTTPTAPGATSTSNSAALGVGVGVGLGVGIGGEGGKGGNATSNAQGGNATATGGKSNSKSAVTGSGNSTNSVSAAGGTSGASANNDLSINVGPDQAAKIPVATAYAAPLTATNGTCFGSASGGAQGPGFGVSFGSTVFDNNCDIRYDAEALRANGLAAAAQARLCQKPEIEQAMKDAGTPCATTKAKTAAASTSTQAATASQSTQQYQDPIIRRRLGLPPL